MRTPFRLSLRHKQTLIIMLVSTAVLLSGGVALVTVEEFAFRRELVGTVSVLADAVGSNCAAAIDFDDEEAARETLGALGANPSIVAAGVYTVDQRMLAAYQRDAGAPEPLPAAPEAGAVFDGERLLVVRPIRRRDARVGTIVVASDLQGLAARRQNYAAALAAIVPVALVMALVLSWRLGRIIVDPIASLARTARAVTEQRAYGVRASKRSNDELGLLVDAFNEMLARIEERDVALQRSHADLEARVVQRTRDLATSLAMVRATLESTTDGILVTDNLGAITGANERFRAMWRLGEVADGAPVQPIVDAIVGATTNPEACRAGIGAAYAHPDEDTFDVLALSDGREIERRSHPQRVDEVSVGRVWSFRDITARRRLEGQLLESSKLETVGRLAGGVAHEFNSIMTVILGHAELLLGALPAAHPLALHALEVQQAGERAAALTRQLLAFGRRQMLRPEALDLNRVLGRVDTVLRHLVGAGVEVRIVPRRVHLVRADASQIEHVVVQLAMRAREAMNAVGTLTIDLGDVAVGPSAGGPHPDLPPGRYVLLEMTDTGVTMDAAARAAIFEPFASLSEDDVHPDLGLATCYGIVKQSGGHIDVESPPGRGTTFRVYLPRVAPGDEARGEASQADAARPSGAGAILLVESDASLREIAAALLGRQGYAVTAVATAFEAIDALDRPDAGPIDLLIADAVPPAGGLGLVQRLRSAHPSARVLLTGASTGQARDAARTPDTRLLAKPYAPAALVRAVGELMGGEPPPASA